MSVSAKYRSFVILDFIGEHNGSYYYISDYSVTSTIAKNRAKAYGGSLAIFEQPEEETWLLSQLRTSYGDRFWMGMKRFGNGFLWDDHQALSYENWLPGRPISSQTVADFTVYPTVGNTILVPDGALVSNVHDMVSNLTVSAGPSSSHVDISWTWTAASSGSYTVDDGINMKLLHYDGYTWNTIYTERYSGINTTNTIEPFLDVPQSASYRFQLPHNANCGSHYFRVAIEDNSFEWDVIEGNFGTGADDSHYDNADVQIKGCISKMFRRLRNDDSY